jgi:hypothetical protein
MNKVVMLFCLCSCVSFSSDNLSLAEAIKEVEQECQVKVRFPVEVTELPEGLDSSTVGVCIVWDSGARHVFLSPTWWKFASPNARRWLVHHELGHCALGRDHDDRLRSGGDPISVMHSSVPANADTLWGDYYAEELCPGAAAVRHSLRQP